jgi:hypothetical protein
MSGVINMKNSVSKLSYPQYINSPEWKEKHSDWLKQANHRCMLFPWLRVGYVDGKYYPYAIHHKDKEAYQNIGSEQLAKHVLVLSRFAHKWVFHWLLSGGKRRVREQKVFPNFWQSVANEICEFNLALFRR